MTVSHLLNVTPIIRKRTFEVVSDEIKRLILAGELKPGDRLPSESELARKFNVGRQTIREAMRLLELSGYIKVEKGLGKGAFVADTIMNTFSNLFLEAFLMRKIDIHDLTVARIEIEKIMIKHVLENVTAEDIRTLEENVRVSKEKIKNKIQPFHENIEFHRHLARISKNSVFILVIELIMTVVSDFRSQVKLPFSFPKKNVADHEKIVLALKNGKKEEVKRLLEDHLRYVGDVMEKALAKSDYFSQKRT
ncbi:MAG: FadR family transcriptional regulator [Desulfobacterota bacterium]|nr:FadR family transcriptional regulator [Thermodesulfobacteriota bacterium]MDW8001888.1 FadR/GntR family transcriptional regulator [Deltaproteobacteria bacterium]